MAHLHSVYDNDIHFSISPITRWIRNESKKDNVIQYDHKSERFTFEIPRYIEGHDMSACDKVEIQYINISKDTKGQSKDVYIADDVGKSPADDGVVIFSWLISGNATRYEGTLCFLIRFVCLNGNTIEYAWNTAIFDEITVGKGMNNGEPVIVQYSDVLEAWKNDILSAFDVECDIVQTTGDSQAKVMSQKAVTDETSRIENDLNEKISRNDKRIANLEQGSIPEPFETDDSVAYVKDVPSNALPYAEIGKIGGMTYRDEATNILCSAKVTEIESVGVNLFDPLPIGTKTILGLTYTAENGYVKINGTKESGANVHSITAPNMIVPSGTYTVSLRMISGSISGLEEGEDSVFFGINRSTYGQRTSGAVNKVGDVGSRTFTLSEPTLISSFDITPSYSSVGAVFNNAVLACQFERSDTMGEFIPCTKHTISIPEAVQALDGYGLGVNADHNNHIEWEDDGSRKWNKNVKRIVLDGTENWSLTTNRFKLDGLEETAMPYTTECVCNKYAYNQTVYSDGATETGVIVHENIIFIRDMGYTSAESFKVFLAEQYANGTPMTVVYVLATPSVTDVSDLITADNFIGVEGNGTITAVNEYGYDVPSEITYMLKGETA